MMTSLVFEGCGGSIGISSEPTVWDDDALTLLILTSAPLRGSQPTVWDDDFVSGERGMIIEFKVPSPPCGMETKYECYNVFARPVFRAHRVG